MVSRGEVAKDTAQEVLESTAVHVGRTHRDLHLDLRRGVIRQQQRRLEHQLLDHRAAHLPARRAQS